MATDKPKGFLVALILGIIALPGAAIALSGSSDDSSTSSEVTITAPTAQVALPETTTTTADIDSACGPAAKQLTDAEADGSITPLQQAALDALRPICDAEGRPVAEPPVVVAADGTVQAGSSSTQPASTQPTDTQPTTATTKPDTQWALGTYPVTGGSADIEFSADAARVASVSEAAGFTASVSQPDAQTIHIIFTSQDHVSTIRVEFLSGEWNVTTLEEPKGTSGRDDHEDDDHEDDDDEDHDDHDDHDDDDEDHDEDHDDEDEDDDDDDHDEDDD